jgi:hypothetical protein
MSTTTLHPLATAYLDRLRDAGRRLPRRDFRELYEEVEAHLVETTSSAMSDAEVLTVLDRLGDPEDIVEAQQPSPPATIDGPGAREWSAIVLLLFGGFIFGVGWLVGVVLLWSSRLWTTLDKWIGTLVIPGGYASVLFLASVLAISTSHSSNPTCVRTIPGGAVHCHGGGTVVTSGPSVLSYIVAVLLILAPIAAAIYLGRRASTNARRRAVRVSSAD